MQRAAALTVICAISACSDDGSGAADPSVQVTGEACFADLEPVESSYFETQRLAAADGSLTVWYAREPDPNHVDGPGADARGITEAFRLVRVWIDGRGEDGTCVSDPSALTYAFMHHNWDETWTVTTPRARYTGRDVAVIADDVMFEFTIEAHDASGNALFGPLELTEQGCEVQPPEFYGCYGRLTPAELD